MLSTIHSLLKRYVTAMLLFCKKKAAGNVINRGLSSKYVCIHCCGQYLVLTRSIWECEKLIWYYFKAFLV